MDVQELTNWLTDGLPADQAAIVKAAVERDAVKTKVATVKQASEYAELQTRATSLQQELDDQGTPGQSGYKPGSRAYKKWYDENYAKVQQLAADKAAYEAKYGKLDGTGVPTHTPQSTVTGKTLTAEEVQQLVNTQIQQNYAPKWSELLMSTGSLVQRHMLAGRKNPIDFAVVSDLAAKKYNNNLDLAYDEWDKPERDKETKVATDKEVDRRVQEELQKRNATHQFPAAADFTPSALSSRPKADVDKFDAPTLKQQLAAEWSKAERGDAAA